jgi:hypothetical protein
VLRVAAVVGGFSEVLSFCAVPVIPLVPDRVIPVFSVGCLDIAESKEYSESEELRIRSLQTEPTKKFSTNLLLRQMPSAVSDESRVTYGGNLRQCDIVCACYGCPLNN